MIWSTVGCRSCFCWLYEASPCLAAKNIINLIFLLTIWWYPGVDSCLGFLEIDVCYNHCFLFTKPCYLLPCIILYSKAKLACYSGYLLISYFAFQSPMMKMIFFWCLFYWVLLVFIELVNFSFFGLSGRGIDLDYCGVEWFALEVNWDHSVIFEIALKYCIWGSFWLWGLLRTMLCRAT